MGFERSKEATEQMIEAKGRAWRMYSDVDVNECERKWGGESDVMGKMKQMIRDK